MNTGLLRDVLEATGYVEHGAPAHGVHLGHEARSRCRSRDFAPDALWRSDSALTVYFKHAPEEPSDKRVAGWRREIWNQGFAPLLWVVSPQRIDLYNGFGRPRDTGDTGAHRLRTFRTIESALNELDAFAGRLAMETGHFWRQEEARTVDRGTSVDRQLLRDLSALEGSLVALGLDRSAAQGLIGRSIFTQYLIDRDIVTEQLLRHECGRGTFSSILRDPVAAKRLFEWLRTVFNGDMFPSGNSPAPAAAHLGRVADFLDAVDPESGQMTLFPYQFDVIPVELISSIYEQFAHAHDSSPTVATGTDVFYTRLSLVSLVMDEITDGASGRETVLDLTCGSGVFLVEALRRLVTLRGGDAEPSRAIIRSTLHEQIHGVDVSEAAVRVAAFSLYLAALELDPDPQPPQALTFQPLIGRTLIVGNAWNVEQQPAAEGPLTEHGAPRKFDMIVGNPPWSYRGPKSAAARRRQDPEHALAPRGESLDFAFRAMEFASDETRFGLVLSAVQFFARSGTGATAARRLIEALSPVTLVNLSNQSDWLFPRGKMPAVVLLARRRRSRPDTVTTVQVPWSPVGARSHTFDVAPGDIIDLPLSDWHRKPDLLKGAFLGCRRDLSLLDGLSSRYDTLGNRLHALKSGFHRGLAFGNGAHDSTFLRGLPLLTAEGLRPFSVSKDLDNFAAEGAQEPRQRDTFRAPLLLIKESLLRLYARPVVGVSEEDVVFTQSFFGATFPLRLRDAAHLIAAILSSSLASWFFLMTSSTFGLWKRRIMLRDIERIPIPEIKSSLRSDAGRRLTRLAREMQQNPPAHDDPRWRALDDAVFNLYALDEAARMAARDGWFRASWQWDDGRENSAEAANPKTHVLAYARAFLSTMDGWLAATERRHMRAEVFDLPMGAPLRVVRFVIEDGYVPSSAELVAPDGNLRTVLHRIGQRLDVPLGTSLAGQRELRVHGRREVVIIKPAARRHWMSVTALDDADAVVVDSLSGTAT